MRRRVETPRQIERMLDDIVRSVEDIRRDYAWVYRLGFEPGSGGIRETQRGDTSDPTGNVVASEAKDDIRDQIRRTSGIVVAAAGEMKAAAGALDHAQDIADPRPTIEPASRRKIGPDELAASHAAQRRRHARAGRLR